jgi:hypothetical protein
MSNQENVAPDSHSHPLLNLSIPSFPASDRLQCTARYRSRLPFLLKQRKVLLGPVHELYKEWQCYPLFTPPSTASSTCTCCQVCIRSFQILARRIRYKYFHFGDEGATQIAREVRHCRDDAVKVQREMLGSCVGFGLKERLSFALPWARSVFR